MAQPQPVAVVSMDGVPLNENDPAVNRIRWADVTWTCRRAEGWNSCLRGPAEGVQAQLITRIVDTGRGGRE